MSATKEEIWIPLGKELQGRQTAGLSVFVFSIAGITLYLLKWF